MSFVVGGQRDCGRKRKLSSPPPHRRTCSNFVQSYSSLSAFSPFAIQYHVVCQYLTYMASAPVARECTVSGLESVLAFLSEVPFVPHASKPPGFVSLQKLCQRRTPYALSHSTCQLPVPTHTHSTRQLPVCRTPYALSHTAHASFPPQAACSLTQHTRETVQSTFITCHAFLFFARTLQDPSKASQIS